MQTAVVGRARGLCFMAADAVRKNRFASGSKAQFFNVGKVEIKY